LLSLAKRYGNGRLETACQLTLAMGSCKYKHVATILRNNRDRVTEAAGTDWVSPAHPNLRGPAHYQ
jgi:hypothetical protein